MAQIRMKRMKMQKEWKERCEQLEFIGEITEEEVKKHQKDDDFWVIIGDDVYDITQYLMAHPGGKRCLVSSNDITKQFNSFHRGQHLDLIEKLKIGYISRKK